MNYILIGIILGIIIFVLTYIIIYFCTKNDPNDPEGNQSINYLMIGLISLIVAVVVSALILFSYKQYIIYKGSNARSHEPYE